MKVPGADKWPGLSFQTCVSQGVASCTLLWFSGWGNAQGVEMIEYTWFFLAIGLPGLCLSRHLLAPPASQLICLPYKKWILLTLKCCVLLLGEETTAATLMFTDSICGNVRRDTHCWVRKTGFLGTALLHFVFLPLEGFFQMCEGLNPGLCTG